MRIRYWGTRGSIPTPGPSTIRYGGNTVCVEVRADSGDLLVLDCGSGARGLGQSILVDPDPPKKINILLTHTHWDHIQGFPFFGPAFASGFDVQIYGPSGTSRSLEQSIAGQMDPTYFPVSFDHLASKVRFHDLGEETFQIGDFTITSRHLNHTSPTLGYRITCHGRTLVYATDHEPPERFWHTWPGHGAPPNGTTEPDLDRVAGHLDLARDANLLLHDAQYVEDEYPARRGWGHSTVEYAANVAIRAGARRLVLFHHDPYHNDRFVDQATSRAREIARDAAADLEIVAAMEGDEEILVEDPHEPTSSGDRTAPVKFADPTEPLRSIGLFERIATPDLKALREIAQVRRFAAGDVLVRQSDLTGGVTVVTNGLIEACARVSLMSYQIELPLSVLGAGSTITELGLLDDVASPATYTAVGPVDVLAIDRVPFLALLEDRPHIGLRVLSVMARELKRHDEIVQRVPVDPVSGAFTRLALEEYFRREASRIQRRGGALTLLSLHVGVVSDNRDAVPAFDRSALLTKVAHAARVAIRQTDLTARYSWNEFVMLLVDTDERGGWRVADRLNRILSELPDLAGQLRWRIGVSSHPGGDAPLDVLVSRAQQIVR